MMPKRIRRSIGSLSIALLFLPGSVAVTQDSSQKVPDMAHAVKVIVRTDHDRYSRKDPIQISASLHNTGEQPIYIDRRMFWTGLGGGLELEITDEQGKHMPSRPFSDGLAPPPVQSDPSILVRLDQGFFYGTSLILKAGDFFPSPGKYSIRVVYKSSLSKEFVLPQQRDLPALWDDAPQIPSEPVWINITNSPK